MSEIIDIESALSHQVAEVICVKCLNRYVCVWPNGTRLKDLECEACGSGYIILTGENIDD